MRLNLLKPALLGAAVGLAALPALAQTKVTNQGVSANEIVIGTHQDLSGPIKVWGVPVSNGMKQAVEEINAAGGINGRKLRLVLEDSQYDPKKAVLASQKMVEKDKVFAMVGPMGSPTVLASQDVLFDAGVPQLFPLTAAEFTFKFDPAKPQERLKFSNILPYVESTRAALKHMIELKKPKALCIMYQDDEYGKNVYDGFTQQLTAMNLKPASVTTYKRGASDFSAQAAKMKSDGCDLVLMGTVIRETIGLMAEAKKIGFAPIWLGASPVNVLEIPALGKELVEGLYAAAGFEVPYDDIFACSEGDQKFYSGVPGMTGNKRLCEQKAPVLNWMANYRKMFNSPPNTQAVIGYNAVMTFAFYVNLAGKELTGDKLLAALESGVEFRDIFNSPASTFSKTNHLATTITQVQIVKNGKWVLVKDGLTF